MHNWQEIYFPRTEKCARYELELWIGPVHQQAALAIHLQQNAPIQSTAANIPFVSSFHSILLPASHTAIT